MPPSATPPVYRYVGRIIHVMRKERGMRQSELASLTGLKQPNLSRIENGVVVPRKSTLRKIAEALDVEVPDLLSEIKAREVESKWGAAMSPKNAGALFSGHLTPVPLFAIHGSASFDVRGWPADKEELTLQLPPLKCQAFALCAPDRTMELPAPDPHTASFKKGEVLVFGDEVARSGQFALVITTSQVLFRKLLFNEPSGRVRLLALNPTAEEQSFERRQIKAMWKLIRHLSEW